MTAKDLGILCVAVLAMFALSSPTSYTDLWGNGEKITGSGNVVTENREVGSIQGIELSTFGKMTIQLGNRETLSIKAEDNILQNLVSEMSGSTLKISKKKNVNLKPKKPVEYLVTVKSLNSITLNSSGDAVAPKITSDSFTINLNSSGDLQMNGLETGALTIRLNSSGDASLGPLAAKHASIHLNSSGDLSTPSLDAASLEAHLNSSGDMKIDRLVAKTLAAKLNSSGDLLIKGGEVVEQSVKQTSSGDYNGKALSSLNATVSLSSSGDSYLNVRDNLVISVSSSGDVHYKGDPDIVMKKGKMKKVHKM